MTRVVKKIHMGGGSPSGTLAPSLIGLFKVNQHLELGLEAGWEPLLRKEDWSGLLCMCVAYIPGLPSRILPKNLQSVEGWPVFRHEISQAEFCSQTRAV